jgi:hypothetical protein
MQVFRTCCLALRVQYEWAVKLLLLHLVGVPYLPTYIDDARSNTNQVLLKNLNCFYLESGGLPPVHNVSVYLASDTAYHSKKNWIFNNIAMTTQNIEICGLTSRTHLFIY